MAPWQRQLLDRLPEPMRRDVKKTCVLAGLGVVFAGVMLKQFGGAIFARGAADDASAAVAAAAAPPADNAGGRGATAGPRDDARGGGRVGRWLATPVRPLDRNVFAMRYENFQSVAAPQPAAAPVSVRVVDEGGTFWDQLAKSLGARADQRKQKQIRIDNLQAAAAQVRVTSTILGASPGALIEGRLRKVGDVVATTSNGAQLSFRIVRIEPRRIVIERDGVRLELTLNGRTSVLAESGNTISNGSGSSSAAN